MSEATLDALREAATAARVLYVCDMCQEHAPEQCGRDDIEELRVMPSGKCICSECYEDYPDEYFPEIHAMRMSDDDTVNDTEYPLWSDLPIPSNAAPCHSTGCIHYAEGVNDGIGIEQENTAALRARMERMEAVVSAALRKTLFLILNPLEFSAHKMPNMSEWDEADIIEEYVAQFRKRYAALDTESEVGK
jgi:hypothetical protein